MAKYKTKLDPYERKIEESLENYRSVSSEDKMRILQAGAKSKTISLRINEIILESIKHKASEEGLPYQTLISSVLYKFATGRLMDGSAIRKVVEALK
jgi:predicted DNA binding CopG/RHH family protein